MFRIKNITNLLDKRHPAYNTSVEIEYINGLLRKKITIKPDNDIILSSKSLLPSVDRLRLNGHVLITQVTGYEIKNRNIELKTAVATVENTIEPVEKTPKIKKTKDL